MQPMSRGVTTLRRLQTNWRAIGERRLGRGRGRLLDYGQLRRQGVGPPPHCVELALEPDLLLCLRGPSLPNPCRGALWESLVATHPSSIRSGSTRRVSQRAPERRPSDVRARMRNARAACGRQSSSPGDRVENQSRALSVRSIARQSEPMSGCLKRPSLESRRASWTRWESEGRGVASRTLSAPPLEVETTASGRKTRIMRQ